MIGNLELLAGPNGAEVIAQFHRLLWTALYYPENILSYLKTGDSGIPTLGFFVPYSSSESQLVENIIEEMKKSPHYSSQLLPNDEYSSMVKRCIRNNSVETVIFADERDLFDENLNAPGTLVAFVVAEIVSNLELVVHNLDTESKWYRASLRGQDLGVAVIEVGRILPDETDASILSRASQCASSVGVGNLIEPVILKSRIYIFPPQVGEFFRNRHSKIKNVINNNPSCNLTNEITGSINNQVCLGLKSSQVIIREFIK